MNSLLLGSTAPHTDLPVRAVIASTPADSSKLQHPECHGTNGGGPDRGLKVGYLHLGSPEHGVRRYGQLLADEARTRPAVEVFEVDTAMGSSRLQNRRHLIAAARQLSASDIVHIQYNCQLKHSIWGAGWHQLDHLATFIRNCPRPVVATLHDVYEHTSLHTIATLSARCARLAISRYPRRQNGTPDSLWSLCSSLRKQFRSGSALAAVVLHYLIRHLDGGFVCSREEHRRLRTVRGWQKISVIPHFVEARRVTLERTEAKARLGLAGKRVVTLLGYIHPRKGWRLLIDTLGSLPDDVVLVFAGAESSSGGAAGEIMRIAEASGLGTRVRVTGYLSEEMLEYVLAATDLAVCPFKSVSASGSVSTWISVPRPILASDLPLFGEYNQLVGNAIAIFSPYTADALAARIVASLSAAEGPALTRLHALREQLALPAIVSEHLHAYRVLLAQRLTPKSRGSEAR